ncbi:hypothetical protein RND81_03G048000 [Saponaria officinalis]|uniref:Uncharacterized protein n=1 Tax=Saponaria officinalis TaxID=3572 RepID=A0AAW1LYQ9_SAPOF
MGRRILATSLGLPQSAGNRLSVPLPWYSLDLLPVLPTFGWPPCTSPSAYSKSPSKSQGARSNLTKRKNELLVRSLEVTQKTSAALVNLIKEFAAALVNLIKEFADCELEDDEQLVDHTSELLPARV